MAHPGATVRARQKRSSPKEPFENAFIAKMTNKKGPGHTGIFERRGMSSLPIREFMGASTPEMAENSVVLEKVEAAAMETIKTRMEHEIARILNGRGRR